MLQAKHILVLGGTGPSGTDFTDLVLSDPSGAKITLYVRTPSKLPSEYREAADPSRLRIVVGELDDQATLERALTEPTVPIDVVVSFLGPYASLKAFLLRTSSTPLADKIPTVLAAMKHAGVRRILAISSPAWLVQAESDDKATHPHESSDQMSWGWWLAMRFVAFILPQGSVEMEQIGRRVAEEGMHGGWGLKWTVFRIPRLNNGPDDLEVCAGYLGQDFNGSKELSRKSMARWLVGELAAGEWIDKAPVVSNRR
ncbi:hypothetical protein LTR84_000453 [Exophiala bonariae]|uniref:NAD(P)-binding domain-containing protein n=1 Tax=Exophiala bonariae TaxID=1690606 RepID=A0AAV9NQJ4_9EURO|nr:hypothetical protein LTR84_000453 [Exophiala bonariae]